MIAQSSANPFGYSQHVLIKGRHKKEPWLITAKDIRNIASIQAKLFAGDQHPLILTLLSRIAPPNLAKIKSYAPDQDDSGGTCTELLREFNRLFDSADELCRKCAEARTRISLRDETRALLDNAPRGKEQKKLARLLLEDCFSDGIKQLPGYWERPDIWLGKQRDGIPTVEAVRELAPNVSPWLLLEALCIPASEEENLFRGILPIIGGLDEKVTETLTRREWFRKLAALLQRPEEPDATFSQCLEKHWGPLIQETQSPKGTQRTINPLNFAALCASRLRLWFDPRENAFYWYQPRYGTWTFLTETETKRLILEWILVQRDIPEAKATLQMVDKIVKHLKIIALYERTDLDASPVHLASEMLYLNGEVQRADFSPAYFSKNRIPIPYDSTKEERNAKFVDFLERSLPQDDIDLLQSWCGHVLLGKNPEHRILLIRGPGGTGKSTLMDILEAVIGSENVATLNVERLDDRFELAAFRGKTLLIGKDVASDVLRSKAAHTLKALSGDRGIEAELKFENQRFKLTGPFNIALTSNSDLEVGLRGDAEAWERRLLVIDFNVRPKEKILNYASTIIDSSPAGILNWMVQGAQKVMANQKLVLSPRQEERLKRLLGQSSSVEFFVKTCVSRVEGRETSTDELYEYYVEFCNEQVLHPLEMTLFQRRIRIPIFQMHQARADENVKNLRGDKCRGYKPLAIRLKAEWPIPYEVVSESVKQFDFWIGDVLDLEKIQERVSEGNDDAIKWIFARLTKVDEEENQIKNDEGEPLIFTTAGALVAKLNNFVHHPDYTSKAATAALAFLQPTLRPDTKKLLDQKLAELKALEEKPSEQKAFEKTPRHKADIRRLKRWVLEDVFQGMLKTFSESPVDEKAKPKSPGNSGNTENSKDVPF